MEKCHLVTGATGLLGSHLAEQLVQAGHRVRALVRPSSQTSFLQSLGVECVTGDLTEPESLLKACQSVDTIFHSAAKVGDWGTRAEFEKYTIAGTRHIAEAALQSGVRRFLHVSSTSAYGHPPSTVLTVDESTPLGSRFWLWDDYTRAKVEAEKLLWEMHHTRKLPLSVVRPSWLYGPRDRLTIQRIHQSLSRGKVRILGNGTNRMNTVYAGSVARCCILASETEAALGQAYNATYDGAITQREWLYLWADTFRVARPARRVPYALAFQAGFLLEMAYRLMGAKKPPLITRYSAWLLGRPTFYLSHKAEQQLGWKPVVTYQEGVQKTVDWYLRTSNQIRG